MSAMREETGELAIQQLVTRRFAMASVTYGLALMLTWVVVASGFYEASTASAITHSALIVVSQLLFFWLFHRGINLRFKDPSLTEPQVLVALLWLTYFLFNLGSARGSLLVLYLLVLMFAVFLQPKVFIRYAALAFLSFVGLAALDYYLQRAVDSTVFLLQASVLLVTLIWMCLFAGHVYRLRQRMRQRRFALQAHQDTLRGMMRQLEDLASTDELTGLYNRRRFLRIAEGELSRLRKGHQFGLALIDLDHFKRVNDIHGHAAGDRVLQTFASVARSCLRDADVLARYGGEEFVLLLPDTDAEQFSACCERLREAFSKAEPEEVDIAAGHLSLSIGLTLVNAGDDLDAALQRADEALYRAKRAGRNRCEPAWITSDA
ncbi:sensor domain-containing diguanylate cyclase [Stutzerimonas stutzeri]|uniref:diguanylate cyclase n=1 Tax=Stutzerimonas stutzeri RCH2 TaxID=644801 RepID=L0GPH0_STUST|nr:GGDEF domain-containing protein [Stutzerimonas stutzeri]AGA87687.1 diguanylate cyclase (GGDEF) domain-containing protein [Stutzerimonas stutzeri RCH2]